MLPQIVMKVAGSDPNRCNPCAQLNTFIISYYKIKTTLIHTKCMQYIQQFTYIQYRNNYNDWVLRK